MVAPTPRRVSANVKNFGVLICIFSHEKARCKRPGVEVLKVSTYGDTGMFSVPRYCNINNQTSASTFSALRLRSAAAPKPIRPGSRAGVGTAVAWAEPIVKLSI